MQVRLEAYDLHDEQKLSFGIVVYNELFYRTPSFISILAAIQASSLEDYYIYIYDNSDDTAGEFAGGYTPMFDRVKYFQDKTNPGISVAYNFLAKQALDDGFEWIVFMDHDTHFPLNSVIEYQRSIVLKPDLPIKAPVLYSGNTIFSPTGFMLAKSFTLREAPSGVYSMARYKIVNSGMLIFLPFFFKVGGYNEKVRLDFSDDQFIARAKRSASAIDVLPIICQHSYSGDETNIDKALSRYESYLTDLANCDRNNFNDRITYFMTDLIHLWNLVLKFRSLRFLTLYLRKKTAC